MNSVNLGPEYFPLTSAGKPVSNGDIYVGIVDLDPEILANQLQLSVQQEDGNIVNVAQPVKTGGGGVPLYNGSPVTLLVEGNYSLKVLDSGGIQIFYVPSVVGGGIPTTDGKISIGAYGDNLDVALTAIGATEMTLLIDTTVTLLQSDTVPENVTLEKTRAGLFTGAFTLTIDGSMSGDLGSKWFDTDVLVRGLGQVEDVKPEWWGVAGDGLTNDTVALQSAINTASNTTHYTVTISSGHYIYTTLYFFYDAILNPGYNSNAAGPTSRHGRMEVKGDGALDIASLRTYNPGFGTVLESTNAATNSFIVASDSAGHGSSPYPARKFTLSGITLVADSTATVFESAACSEIRLSNVSILQIGVGSGADIRSAWYGSVENTIILNDNAAATGTGLILGSDAFAGLFEITQNSLIDGFKDNISWESGTWGGCSIRDTAIQSASQYSIHVKAGKINQFNLDNVNFEGDGRTSDIFNVGNSIRHLSIRNSFFLGGTTTASFVSGPMLDIGTVSSLDVSNSYIFRMWGTFCDIDSFETGASTGGVEFNSFIHDNEGGVTGPVYLFTGDLPELSNNTWTGMGDGTQIANTFQLYDFANDDLIFHTDALTGVKNIGRLSLGPVHVEVGQSGTYSTTANGTHMVYDITNTVASSATLSNGTTQLDGRSYFIKNNASSVDVLNVKNTSDGSTISALAVGEGGFFVLDKFVSGKFIRML